MSIRTSPTAIKNGDTGDRSPILTPYGPMTGFMYAFLTPIRIYLNNENPNRNVSIWFLHS